MARNGSPVAWAFVAAMVAAFPLATQTHASARPIRIDNGWVSITEFTGPSTFTPAALTPPVPEDLGEFSGWPTLTVDVNSPVGLFGTDFSDSTQVASVLGDDAMIWCAGEYCQPTEGAPGGDVWLSGVLAQLMIEPSTIPSYSGDLEFDLFYDCSNPFSFSVNGKAPSIPTCPKVSGEVNATFIYSYANGSLEETTVPEPGSIALFACALGLLGVWRASRILR